MKKLNGLCGKRWSYGDFKGLPIVCWIRHFLCGEGTLQVLPHVEVAGHGISLAGNCARKRIDQRITGSAKYTSELHLFTFNGTNQFPAMEIALMNARHPVAGLLYMEGMCAFAMKKMDGYIPAAIQLVSRGNHRSRFRRSFLCEQFMEAVGHDPVVSVLHLECGNRYAGCAIFC